MVATRRKAVVLRGCTEVRRMSGRGECNVNWMWGIDTYLSLLPRCFDPANSKLSSISFPNWFSGYSSSDEAGDE